MPSESTGIVASTRPPAKLNLFLELLARRDDGYHEIDTVMVPVDWCDELRVRRSQRPGIRIDADWMPSRAIIANRLGIAEDAASCKTLLSIPEDDRNLVHRALSRFVECFAIGGGFECRLQKSIPAGAGMGGASSDAAAALRCAAALCGIPLDTPELTTIATEIGSDVPFFLGLGGPRATRAARARGRGEILDRIDLTAAIDFVIVFPGVSLSTAEIYANCHVSPDPQGAEPLITALESGAGVQTGSIMINRLAEPAKKKAPRIAEILNSLWHVGLETCQLTGSGSACFAIASANSESKRCAAYLRARHEPGAIVRAARATSVPARVELT